MCKRGINPHMVEYQHTLVGRQSPLPSLQSDWHALWREEYVTVFSVLPILKLIEGMLLKEETSDTQFTKNTKQNIEKNLSR